MIHSFHHKGDKEILCNLLRKQLLKMWKIETIAVIIEIMQNVAKAFKRFQLDNGKRKFKLNLWKNENISFHYRKGNKENIITYDNCNKNWKCKLSKFK